MKNRTFAALVVAGSLAWAGCASTAKTTAPPVSTGPTEVSTSEAGVIPVGQELDVRLRDPLSSATARPEQHFETTTLVDVRQGDRVLIPAGSVVRGVVRAAEPAGKIDRTGRLTLAFDQLSVGGRNYQLRAMATQVFESGGIREEQRTLGAAGVAGAIIGGIIGGVKGALIGAAVGAGGVIAATEGKDIELPAGSILRIRLDSPLQLR
jgi:hypothetical protein